MSLMKRARTEQQRADDTPAFDRERCPARGCPLRPVANTGQGMQCTAHVGLLPNEWPRITEGVERNMGVVQLISEIKRLSMASTPKDPRWQNYATEYWNEVDRFCVPNAAERRNVDAYLYRMYQEFLWRIGRTQARPRPFGDPNANRVPKPVAGFEPVTEAFQ